ncbi:MAG: hypothetical protein AB7G65_19340 [Thermoleophilia bacterium]
MPADLYVAAVLGFINEARRALDLPPVADLRGGERLHPWACPICRTLAVGMPRNLMAEFSGTRLRVWRRGTSLLEYEADAPPTVVAWSEMFDRAERDVALALTPEEARVDL